MSDELKRAIAGLSIVQLRHFCLVASTLSFREAAETAFRSQPALSLSIKEMESRLGVGLFERTKSKLELTPIGAELLPIIKAFLVHHERVCSEFELLVTGQAGAVRFGVIPAQGEWLTSIIAEFRSRAPKVRLDVLSDNPVGLISRLTQGDLDFCLCTVGSLTVGYDVTPITDITYGLVCRDDHELASASSTSLEELSRIPLLGSSFLKESWIAGPMGGGWVDSLHIMNLQVMLSSIEGGLGATVMPRYAVSTSGRPRLCFVPISDAGMKATLGTVKLSNSARNSAALRLEEIAIRTIRDAFSSDPPER